MKKIILIIIFLSTFFTYNIEETFGQEFSQSDYIENTINSLGITDYDYEINKNIINGPEIKFSFSEIVKKAINGELKDISIFDFINYILNTLFSEIFTNSKIIKNTIIISLLCAFLKTLTDSFKNKGVGEMGFYAGYMVIATLLINSFNLAIGVLIETITSISNIINSLVPLLAGTLVISGASASGAVFTGVIIGFINIVAFIMNKIFIPLISAMVVLN
ncbi:MAG: stage III sporulation protein AE, partial [Eubacteriales bacterium]|nr:stage III sporulation protein AE [Eubacteriales bacterium]